ncbi:hypothetical protein AB0395_48590 [Streptosporangium sp. NPDC051023]|uniref:hypothetical protein n=1 Tax=Streptosporangium sp. NPDC051023 TaxID=3155410 RepID=UPI00344D3812
MTAYPIPENHGHWWLTTRRSWSHLHAVPGGNLTPDDLHDSIDWADPLERQTACGPVLDLTYAGIGSRFSMPRCAHCCRTLGIPAGRGTPVNEAAEKRLAEEKTHAR